MIKSRPSISQASGGDFPATARLRAELLIAPDSEALVAMFAGSLAEHGITGHFCLRRTGAVLTPLLGDSPDLFGRQQDCLVVDSVGTFPVNARVLLAAPAAELSAEHMVRVRGYALLFAARAIALQELADDVATECGLTLRERYVLGRRLAGLAPIDIAIEASLSVETISSLIDSAVDRLGAAHLADAISLAARRGWLAVTSLENCSLSSSKISYNALQNGG